jgi:hypothetical protein
LVTNNLDWKHEDFEQAAKWPDICNTKGTTLPLRTKGFSRRGIWLCHRIRGIMTVPDGDGSQTITEQSRIGLEDPDLEDGLEQDFQEDLSEILDEEEEDLFVRDDASNGMLSDDLDDEQLDYEMEVEDEPGDSEEE